MTYKPSIKNVEDTSRKSMSDKDACCYVPVQKFTIALAMLVTARYCKNCRDKCEDCEIARMYSKLKWSIAQAPMFDEEFNVLEPPKTEGENE